MHYLMLAEMGYEVAQYNAAFLLDAGMYADYSAKRLVHEPGLHACNDM